MLQRWTGAADYDGIGQLEGKQEVRLTAREGPKLLSIDFGRSLPVGSLVRGEPFLTSKDGAAIARRLGYGGNLVFAFGFPLGLNNNELWDLAPVQDPRDALTPIYEELVAAAGVDRPVLAPHNLRVYVGGDGKMLLVRERAGLETNTQIAVRFPSSFGPVSYTHLTLPTNREV